MKKNGSLLFAITLMGTIVACNINATNQGSSLHLKSESIDSQLNDAVNQYKVLAQNLNDTLVPKSYYKDKDSLETSKTSWWTSGFYPGTLLYLYEYSSDTVLLKEAEEKLTLLEQQKDNTHTHDLGFMLYCSFGNANRLTENPHYKQVMLTGAESLLTRYHPTVHSIRSWDHNKDKWQFPVIIDNMMNLEFLNWASRESGDSKFADAAKSHANTTMKNHFREDYSSYHVIDYDTISGEVRHKQTAQGAGDETAWARGQAWGLYGYTMMFRDTKDSAYLQQAVHIADYILNHPNLPEDGIPYWDFDADNIPDAKRDASAGAIMASALLELQEYANNEQQPRYIAAAERMIRSLGSPSYKAKAGTNGGFILEHSVGHLTANSEVDVPLTYADYYYVEALMRYKKMLDKS